VADAGVSAAPAALRERLAAVQGRHGEVYVLVGPPRTASTAVSRILWNHPAVGWYAHEPFEPTWYEGAAVERAAELLEAPEPVAALGGRGAGRALVVKEMTFQVADAFPLLASLAKRPLVFLIRDPRLTIASRMEVLRRSGRPELFPLRESGWEDLAWQLAWVRREGIPHVVVDSSDLRAAPEAVVPPLLATLGLDFAPELLRWGPSGATGLSAVSGAEDPFYQRVLDSGGLEPPSESPPDVADFPAPFRAHVAECLAQYEELRDDWRSVPK
jgi:sulfotransferase family protein